MNIESEIEALIGREGGYVNHPNDRGGATKFGVTRVMLGIHRDAPVLDKDIKAMKIEEAREVYQTIFIKQPNIDKLPDPMIAALVFDFGVHSGTRKAIKVLQLVLGLHADGIIGPKTASAVRQADTTTLAIKYLAERMEYLAAVVAANPSQAVFIRGWIRRAKDLMNDVLDDGE